MASLRATSFSAAVRHELTVDLFCCITEPDDGIPRGDHNIVIRVWSRDPTLWFRRHLDAADLQQQIQDAGGKRVMQRVHLDFANPGQPGPQFHLQVGGTQHGPEYCWLPESLDLPRFPHYPLTLITACEFVLRTFFPSHYERVAGEATWIGAVRTAQDAYVEPYLRRLIAHPQPLALSASVLGRLWNPAT